MRNVLIAFGCVIVLGSACLLFFIRKTDRILQEEQAKPLTFAEKVEVQKVETKNCGVAAPRMVLPDPGQQPVMVINGQVIPYNGQEDYGLISESGRVVLVKFGKDLFQRPDGRLEHTIVGKWAFDPTCYN